MIAWILAASLGALLLAPLGAAAAEPAEFRLWAMEAHTEGRDKPYFDQGLEAVRDAVKGLKQDTFLKLKTDKHVFKDDAEFRVAINSQYTLNVSAPVAADGGRFRMKLRITMASAKQPDKEIEALASDLLLQPDRKVLVRGLKLGEGREMILVLSLSVPSAPPKSPPGPKH